MKNKLKDKVAIITGGNGGIGYAITKRLVQSGVKVYNISRATINFEEFAKSYEADVNDTEKMKSIIEEI